MDKLVYTALGAIVNQTAQRVQLTNDLANVSTIGYKRSVAARPETVSYTDDGLRFQAILSPRADEIDLRQGHHIETGVQTDIAMNNGTVLGVQTDDGSVAFTRRGDLRTTETGLLELGNGKLVLDDGGNPITVPVDTIISVGTDGTIYGSDNQNPLDPPAPIALLMLRDASGTPLVRRFDGLYDVEDEDQADANGDFPTGPEPISITVGSLEAANADAVEAMVGLLDFYRSFETQLKIIKSTEEMDEDGGRMMRAS